jgi:hypothetical protein
MIGPILVFLSVCLIVAIYMGFVHSFLRASEEPDETNAVKETGVSREHEEGQAERPASRREPQWAH